ncbi:MAG TPA: zinc ribbon domain-containing protein [Xanthomonadales bacterium]|nr:zinc ribbon domain-containing protein [Xanthomonadales bacterium]
MSSAPQQYGILGCSSYLPRWRIGRRTISDAIGWSRGMSLSGRGQRSFAHWDEDSLTMAVEAGRQFVNPDASPDTLQLASTSLPFADRSNSGLVGEALNLDSSCRTFDLAGSRRSATTWLAQCLSEANGTHVLLASDCVDAKPGSESEMLLGHAAAGLMLGPADDKRPLIAHCLASRSMHEDFVDQYRMTDQRFDYRLESRWIRDAGTRKQLGSLIREVLKEADKAAPDIDFLVVPASDSICKTIARDNALEKAERPSVLEQKVGLCAAAQSTLGLCWVLGRAQPGQLVLVAGLGQGMDVLLFQVERTDQPAGQSMNIQLDAGELEENYCRYLGLRGLVSIDGGIRAERDNRTAQSAHYRRHRDLTGFVGGRCKECGQLQYPRTEVCVECRKAGTQVPERMAQSQGTINSYTEDWLAYTARPPLIFGSVHFEGGANVTMEFGDFLADEAQVGMNVKMAFRIKDVDNTRHFRRYFWKPVPVRPDGKDG